LYRFCAVETPLKKGMVRGPIDNGHVFLLLSHRL